MIDKELPSNAAWLAYVPLRRNKRKELLIPPRSKSAAPDDRISETKPGLQFKPGGIDTPLVDLHLTMLVGCGSHRLVDAWRKFQCLTFVFQCWQLLRLC
jgi:hypothetical protein